jgi:hypothetical protein
VLQSGLQASLWQVSSLARGPGGQPTKQTISVRAVARCSVAATAKKEMAPYAVMSFGGFLGLGHSHYPIPWAALKYDTNLGGYRTGITEGRLRDAPEFR